MPLADELKRVKQWVVWRDNKQPYSAITMKQKGWNIESNWATYEDAIRVMRSAKFKGIGFVFKYPYVGIDLDDCIEEDGMMNDFAREITSQIDTFTEYSMSRKGLHLYCKVSEPIESLKTATIEIYGEGRFFAVTGHELDAGQMEVTDQTQIIKKLLAKYQPVRPRDKPRQSRQYTEGERNNGMAAEIGRMFNFWDKDTVISMANTLNQRACCPPLNDSELMAIVESISKRDTKQLEPKPFEYVGYKNVEGLRDLDEVPYMGITKKPGRYIATGIETIDYGINDLAPGCVTLIAGRSSGGKTTFVRQCVANAIDSQNKVFIISGEGDQESYINSLYQSVIGRNNLYYDIEKVNKRFVKEPKALTLKALKQWHKGKIKLFNMHESKFKTTDALFSLMEQEVKDNGHNLIVIDNLMSVLSVKATEKNEAQAEFMQKCCDMALLYKTHVILVLHPNKEFRPGMDFEMEHISGNSDLYNKADNVIVIIREYKEEKIAQGINGQIKVLKNRYFTDIPICDTHFDVESGLLLETKDGQAIAYIFHWDKYMREVAAAEECPWDVRREAN